MRRRLAAGVLAWAVGSVQAQPGPAADGPRQLGQGRSAMVVLSSAGDAAPQALALLRAGGSAMDAAIAAALVQVVACAGAWSSLAGMLSLLHYDAATGKVSALDAGFARAVDPDTALPVPGLLPGLAAAHGRFGRLPWGRLFDPALALAERGVRVGPLLARLLAWRAPALARDPGARAALLDTGGRPLPAGTLLRQPELAATLRRLAHDGPAYMSEGGWARGLAALDAAPTRQDLAAYRARWLEPLSGSAAGRTLLTIGLPQLGGLCLLESLALLGDDLSALRSPRTPAAVARMVRAGEPCYAGFRRLDADPAARLQPRQLQAMRQTLAAADGLPLADRLAGRPPAGHSDIVIAADAAGNVTVLAHSIYTTAWGERPRLLGGVSVSDAGGDPGLLRQLAPSEHLPSALNPTLLMADGRPQLAMASIGASLSELMLQASVDILADGASPAQVVAAPRYLRPLWPRIGGLQFALLGVIFGAALACVGLLRGERLPLRLPLRLPAVLLAAATAAWAAAVLAAATLGWRAPLAGLELVAGRQALALAALLLLGATLWAGRRLRAGSVALLALLVAPLLLRGSLVPVTLVEAGRFDAATLRDWRAAGLAVAEVGADAPVAYWAGLAMGPSEPALQGAVSPGLGGAVAAD